MPQDSSSANIPARPTNGSGPARIGNPSVAAQQRRQYQSRPDGPRRVRHGIKLSSREGVEPRNWVAEAWIASVSVTWSVEARDEAFEYGRSGQTRSLEIELGHVTAQVQGTAATPYDVRLDFAPFDERPWEQIVTSMASFGMLAAQLFNEEMPAKDVLDPALAPVGMDLVPSAPITASCTCPTGRRHTPCKHGATVALLLAERLNADPMLIFMLRGVAAPVLIDRVRRARTIRTHGVASAHAEPYIPETQESAPPLDMCVEEFWKPGSRLHELERGESSSYASHALLRRLGPSPLQGRFPLVGLLQSIYDKVSEEARLMQDTSQDDDADGD